MTTVQLVEQHIIASSDPRWLVIHEAAWFSKNIYNAATYLVRQSYLAGQGYLNYNAIEKKSSLPKNQHTSQRIQCLTHKRNCRMDAYLHVVSRRIIDLMIDTGIGTLVIGKNDGWKQNVELGKRTNQNFVQIPQRLWQRDRGCSSSSRAGTACIKQTHHVHNHVHKWLLEREL